VTFETLLASFGLESDLALTRLGEVVHYDDALLARASEVFDWPFRGYEDKST
jgi:hypothetical protein